MAHFIRKPVSGRRPATNFRQSSTSPRHDAPTKVFFSGTLEVVKNLGGGRFEVQVTKPEKRPGSRTVFRRRASKLVGKAAVIGASEGSSPAAAPENIPVENQRIVAALEKQELATWRTLKDTGELLSSAQICAQLGITRQALSDNVSKGRMFKIDGPSGIKLYPVFYADPDLHRSDLYAVTKELGSIPGSSKWYFFTRPKLSLGKRTPIEALKVGELDQVLATAAGHRERLIGR